MLDSNLIIADIYSIVCGDVEPLIKTKIAKIILMMANDRFHITNTVEKYIKNIINVESNRFTLEIEHLFVGMDCLLNKKEMPNGYHDYPIKGVDKKHKGYRHFHINNDISMIYKITPMKIFLIDKDKHKQLETNVNKYLVYPKKEGNKK